MHAVRKGSRTGDSEPLAMGGGGNSTKILIIDSDQRFRRAILTALSRDDESRIIYSARDLEEAHSHMEELPPDIIIIGSFVLGGNPPLVVADQQDAAENAKIVATYRGKSQPNHGADAYVRELDIPDLILCDLLLLRLYPQLV